MNSRDAMALIEHVEYRRFEPATTVCTVTIHGGWVFVGSSTCARPEEGSPGIGEKQAFDRAVRLLIDAERYHRRRCADQEAAP